MLTADGTMDPLQGGNRLCLAGPEGPRIRVLEVAIDMPVASTNLKSNVGNTEDSL